MLAVESASIPPPDGQSLIVAGRCFDHPQPTRFLVLESRDRSHPSGAWNPDPQVTQVTLSGPKIE
jgi:hypothetical protein